MASETKRVLAIVCLAVLTALLPHGYDKMAPKTFEMKLNDKTYKTYIYVTVYGTPQPPNGRLCIQIMNVDKSQGSIFGVASVNMPDWPTPKPRHFYLKTWGENEGMMEDLISQGVIRLANPEGIAINQWGSKVYTAELAWPDKDMEINIPRGYEHVLR